ncbi:DUF1648 domain-containing protein [Clostridium guangxiense]|uniref:DUF1648 domain-containing protein n=1 Tax=Clostridium guangxiense TaxID=1662055 RepID=UPI0038B3B2B0
MKISKTDLLIFIIPVVIMLLITPFLPNKVPIHFDISGHANGYLDRHFSFILGLMPFIIYKLYKFKHGWN